MQSLRGMTSHFVYESTGAVVSSIPIKQQPRLIGLHGKKGSGKTTIANYLSHKYGYKEYTFAEPLKKAVSVLFDIPRDDLENREIKEKVIPEWGKSPRHYLQWLGTDVLRKEVAEDFLVRRLTKEIDHENAPVLRVVSDVRFDNEANAILDRAGEIWWIERPETDEFSVEDTHSSENGISQLLPTHFIRNDSTLDELFKQVDQTLYSESRY